MSADKHGDPAFPFPAVSDIDGNVIYPGEDGMSLRDYFAGQALAGMIRATPGVPVLYGEMAHHAYQYADAMLAERGKQR